MASEDAFQLLGDVSSTKNMTPDQLKQKAKALRDAGHGDVADLFDAVATQRQSTAPPPRPPDLTDQAVRSAFQRQMMAAQIGETRQSTFLADLTGKKLPAQPFGMPMKAPLQQTSAYATPPPKPKAAQPYGGFGAGLKNLLGL
jgi:hypothetical protein